MTLTVHPAARREVDDAFDWCKAKYGRRVAARLLRRFDLAGQMLVREPGLGTPASDSARTLPLKAVSVHPGVSSRWGVGSCHRPDAPEQNAGVLGRAAVSVG